MTLLLQASMAYRLAHAKKKSAGCACGANDQTNKWNFLSAEARAGRIIDRMSTQWTHIKPSDVLSTDESHTLRQRSDLWGLWLLAHAWGVTALCWVLYSAFPNIATWLLGVVLIGGRQLGLAILMHEGSHGMLFRTRGLNERLTTWLAAAPMIISLGEYRRRHMAHHRFTRTDKDPENYLYTPFPVSTASMTRKILRDLVGATFIRTQIGLFRALWGAPEGRGARLWGFYGPSVVFYAVFIAGFALAGRMDLFLLLWLVPMATTQMAFLRIRNISEHAAVPDLEDPLLNSRTTLANAFERMTCAPYFVNYHIEHHMMPYIPCYRLPQLHRLLLDRGYGERMNIVQGYRDILRINTDMSGRANAA